MFFDSRFFTEKKEFYQVKIIKISGNRMVSENTIKRIKREVT